MNIAGIDYESVKDGEGVRTVVYVSGCSHNCHNCHNPETHDINYGVPFTEELQNKIIENIQKRPFISGLTWSGGDPLHENNLDDVLKFTNRIRLSFPQKSIWLYSGYTWEEIMKLYFKGLYDFQCTKKRQKIISKCDVLVDGQYIDSMRDITLAYRGSKNQRVIDIKKSLKQPIKNGEIILWTD
ncbi:MAG: anaerobic ribonucleoside-triphosphate reductase activating protein [Lachnospiraceae bacterium]|nr:anaerobic ribonucleoside-triphosphate reductase activating protein [Lachnospiraceae bacterium]